MSLNNPGITYIPAPASPQMGIRGYAPVWGWAAGYQTAPYETIIGDTRPYTAPPIPQAFPDKASYRTYIMNGRDATLAPHVANVRGWSAPAIPQQGMGSGLDSC